MTNENLRIKIKSLAAEARIIRHRERSLRLFKAKGGGKEYRKVGQLSERAKATWLDLRNHRTREVRSETRSSLLAYGYLRGTPYLAMESKCWTKPDWIKIGSMIERFSGKTIDTTAFKGWRESLMTHNSRAAIQTIATEEKRLNLE